MYRWCVRLFSWRGGRFVFLHFTLDWLHRWCRAALTPNATTSFVESGQFFCVSVGGDEPRWAFFKIWPSSALSYRGEESIHFPPVGSVLLTLSLAAFPFVTGYALIHTAATVSSLFFFYISLKRKDLWKCPTVSLSHIVLSLILQAHCQGRLCAHPRSHGSAQGPGGHQPLAVRRQLPEWR